MKQACEVVSHLLRAPEYKKIGRHRELLKVKSLLPAHLRGAILFMYEKNQTLFFVLNHPAFLKELNYRLPLIKSLLKEAQSSVLSELSDIKELKAFVSYRAAGVREEAPIKPLWYAENATATFPNGAQDPEIHASFERIRQTIEQRLNLESHPDEESFWSRQHL